MVRQASHFYDFGAYRVDPSERLLFREGKQVTLTPKVFDTLLVLVENAGRILTKDEVMDQVWIDSTVEEANLTRNISVLRKALGENPDDNRYIETIPWRGYRFVADVREIDEGVADLTIEEHSSARISIEKEEFAGSRSLPTLKFRRRAVIGASVVAAGLLVAIATALLYPSRGDTRAEVRSIAVLPFEDLSGDHSQDYFADGMTEAIINKLAQIEAVHVISHTSVMRYKGTTKSIPEISRELGVDAVMTGSLRRSKDNVRITAQLIHGSTDTHLWATDVERHASDVLKLESDLAREVVNRVRIRITSEESGRLASTRTVDPRAYEAYLLGKFHFAKNNEEDYKRAFEHFERATQIDPEFAAAYSGLSSALLQLGIFSVRPLSEAAPAARSAAIRAIELDDQLPEAHLSLAVLSYSFYWDWTTAELEFRRALDLEPGNPMVHRSYGRLLMCLGRHDEAVSKGEIALQLDPASFEAQTDLGRFLYRARRYEEALPHLKRAIEMEPRSVDANVRLGDLLIELGRYEEAIAVFERAREVIGDERFRSFGVSRAYAAMGKEREARQLLGNVAVPSIFAAAVFASLNDNDAAFELLHRAAEDRSAMIVTIKEDPYFDRLHSDPRWQPLLDRLNFP